MRTSIPLFGTRRTYLTMLAAGALVAVLALPDAAAAGCATTADASAVRRSLNQAMHCADKFLPSEPQVAIGPQVYNLLMQSRFAGH